MNPNLHSEESSVEPHLKYNRVNNYAKEIISKDSISCIAVHSKFFVIGTEWGNIYILDHMGYPSSKLEIHAHSTTINQISIDSEGEYIASCSNDGKVMVFGLLDDKTYPVLSFNQEIKAIAISPDFKKTFQFVTGDTRLLLVSKGLLSNHKHKILVENKTTIKNIKWQNHTIVYATSNSVFVFDMREQRLIGIIDSDRSNLINNPDEFYCRIFWINNEKFIIGWGHMVQICLVKEQQNFTLPLKQLEFSSVKRNASKRVEILHSFNIPDLIMGVVPYDKYILAFIDQTNESDTEETNEKPSPLIVILEPNHDYPDGFIELTYEQVPLKDYQTAKYNTLHLDKIPDENQFYIVSSKDLICAREREVDDRIEWLIQKKSFEKALELVKETNSSSTKYNYKDIGKSYLNHLIQNKEFTKAAEICQSILNDTESWENCINKFLQYDCIEILLPYIPYSDQLKLSQANYMLILKNLFNTKLKSFHKLLKTWPPSLYSIKDIINMIRTKPENEKFFNRQPNKTNKKLTKVKDRLIIECLAILYEHNQDFENAVDCYFKLENIYVFQLMAKRKMFDFVKERLVYLFNFDKDQTLTMLMDYINDVPPETIVEILSPTPIWLFNYLDTLGRHNMLASEPYHMKMVTLYADFKKESLLSFLKSSDKYDLNEAIQLCKSKKFNKEVIYLLGRIGQSKKALEMIMSQDDSVKEAIEYCQERDDDDLWQQLMAFSINKPKFIKEILENSGMDINVEKFIRKIIPDTKIPGLRDSLVILLIKNEKKNNLINAHQIGKWNDIFQMIQNRFYYSTKPIICDFLENNKCVLCSKSIVNCTNDFVLFPCSHFSHNTCINIDGGDHLKLSCHLCNES